MWILTKTKGRDRERCLQKALLDILSSLEWIDIVNTVVDKVSKENQLLALPAGLRESCFFTRRGVVGRRVKIVNVRTRNFYRVLVTLLSRECPWRYSSAILSLYYLLLLIIISAWYTSVLTQNMHVYYSNLMLFVKIWLSSDCAIAQ